MTANVDEAAIKKTAKMQSFILPSIQAPLNSSDTETQVLGEQSYETWYIRSFGNLSWLLSDFKSFF